MIDWVRIWMIWSSWSQTNQHLEHEEGWGRSIKHIASDAMFAPYCLNWITACEHFQKSCVVWLFPQLHVQALCGLWLRRQAKDLAEFMKSPATLKTVVLGRMSCPETGRLPRDWILRTQSNSPSLPLRTVLYQHERDGHPPSAHFWGLDSVWTMGWLHLIAELVPERRCCSDVVRRTEFLRHLIHVTTD